jgi:hypothetical protein
MRLRSSGFRRIYCEGLGTATSRREVQKGWPFWAKRSVKIGKSNNKDSCHYPSTSSGYKKAKRSVKIGKSNNKDSCHYPSTSSGYKKAKRSVKIGNSGNKDFYHYPSTNSGLYAESSLSIDLTAARKLPAVRSWTAFAPFDRLRLQKDVG